MAGGTACQFVHRPDVVLGHKFFSDLVLICGRFPLHVENLVLGSNIFCRVAMAIDTPLHVERRSLENQRHLIHGAVAGGAADALIDVNAVVEINVVGQAVHSHPLDGLIGAETFADRLQIGRIIK